MPKSASLSGRNPLKSLEKQQLASLTRAHYVRKKGSVAPIYNRHFLFWLIWFNLVAPHPPAAQSSADCHPSCDPQELKLECEQRYNKHRTKYPQTHTNRGCRLVVLHSLKLCNSLGTKQQRLSRHPQRAFWETPQSMRPAHSHPPLFCTHRRVA
jgi:hypothetical protein